MKKTLLISSILTLILGGWAAALWLLPSAVNSPSTAETRYGISEGLELVELSQATTGKRYVVEDAEGNELFTIPLRHCLLDTHYRNGQLRFREQSTQREGYIDRQGIVVFADNTVMPIPEDKKQLNMQLSTDMSSAEVGNKNTTNASQRNNAAKRIEAKGNAIGNVDLQQMAHNNPFYKEAAKVIQGRLSENDAKRRHMILNYCEHFRTAYTTKDIDFLKQVFGDNALIIVGNVVKPIAHDNKYQAEAKVSYAIHSKHEYISRLSKVFASNKNIDVKFSGFTIMRHPTMDGIYGVTLRQQYKSDRYSDDGFLFLLWDFRDKAMPLIHVRTWQPARTINSSNEVINIQDFNLE